MCGGGGGGRGGAGVIRAYREVNQLLIDSINVSDDAVLFFPVFDSLLKRSQLRS